LTSLSEQRLLRRPREIAAMPFDFRLHERRSATRYAANNPPAFLGWYEGDRYRSTPVKVIDLSLSGIQVEVEGFPPSQGEVWLSVVGQKPSQWIEVSIVKRSREWQHLRLRRRLRLKFLESCPYDFFEVAIEGFKLSTQDPKSAAECDQDQVWRR
jgi:hypothetical protein